VPHALRLRATSARLDGARLQHLQRRGRRDHTPETLVAVRLDDPALLLDEAARAHGSTFWACGVPSVMISLARRQGIRHSRVSSSCGACSPALVISRLPVVWKAPGAHRYASSLLYIGPMNFWGSSNAGSSGETVVCVSSDTTCMALHTSLAQAVERVFRRDTQVVQRTREPCKEHHSHKRDQVRAPLGWGVGGGGGVFEHFWWEQQGV
jgi:hypothetical protein